MNKEEIIKAVTNSLNIYSFTSEALEKLMEVARADTLEEAAKVCEQGWKEGIGAKYQGDVFAAAIRALKT